MGGQALKDSLTVGGGGAVTHRLLSLRGRVRGRSNLDPGSHLRLLRRP